MGTSDRPAGMITLGKSLRRVRGTSASQIPTVQPALVTTGNAGPSLASAFALESL